jgi:hypothetical protein
MAAYSFAFGVRVRMHGTLPPYHLYTFMVWCLATKVSVYNFDSNKYVLKI